MKEYAKKYTPVSFKKRIAGIRIRKQNMKKSKFGIKLTYGVMMFLLILAFVLGILNIIYALCISKCMLDLLFLIMTVGIPLCFYIMIHPIYYGNCNFKYSVRMKEAIIPYENSFVYEYEDGEKVIIPHNNSLEFDNRDVIIYERCKYCYTVNLYQIQEFQYDKKTKCLTLIGNFELKKYINNKYYSSDNITMLTFLNVFPIDMVEFIKRKNNCEKSVESKNNINEVDCVSKLRKHAIKKSRKQNLKKAKFGIKFAYIITKILELTISCSFIAVMVYYLFIVVNYEIALFFLMIILPMFLLPIMPGCIYYINCTKEYMKRLNEKIVVKNDGVDYIYSKKTNLDLLKYVYHISFDKITEWEYDEKTRCIRVKGNIEFDTYIYDKIINTESVSDYIFLNIFPEDINALYINYCKNK